MPYNNRGNNGSSEPLLPQKITRTRIKFDKANTRGAIFLIFVNIIFFFPILAFTTLTAFGVIIVDGMKVINSVESAGSKVLYSIGYIFTVLCSPIIAPFAAIFYSCKSIGISMENVRKTSNDINDKFAISVASGVGFFLKELLLVFWRPAEGFVSVPKNMIQESKELSAFSQYTQNLLSKENNKGVIDHPYEEIDNNPNASDHLNPNASDHLYEEIDNNRTADRGVNNGNNPNNNGLEPDYLVPDRGGVNNGNNPNNNGLELDYLVPDSKSKHPNPLYVDMRENAFPNTIDKNRANR